MTDMPVDLPAWLKWGVYIIQQVGFPAAVAWFVLGRLNGRLGSLKDAVTDLRDEIRAIRR